MNKGKIMAGVSSTFGIVTSNWMESNISTGSNLMSIGFTTTKYNDEVDLKSSSFNLLPRAGYFVIDNLAIGLDIIVGTSKWRDPDDDDTGSNMLLCAGPFVRYYFPFEKLYPFVEVNSAFGSLNSKYEYGEGTNKYKNSVTTFGGGIGAAFPLGDRLTFDLMASYKSFVMKEKDDDNDDKMNLGTFGLQFGFLYFFGSN
jgi:hypothetical protein